ncbi:MAG: hypothetical protein P4L46_13490 [Fimbriimonas sp.]|nr:hypothetical protein [Fimbriimonas sp.]
MVHCVSETCRREIDEDWDFCAYCGADNRAPEKRYRVRYCIHRYPDNQHFCIFCGGRYGDRYWEVPAWQRRIGFLAIAGGALLWLAALVIWLVHTKGQGALFQWVNSWYDATHTEYSRYSGPHQVANGRSIIGDLFLGGIFGFLAGGSMVSTPRAKFYSDDTWN